MNSEPARWIDLIWIVVAAWLISVIIASGLAHAACQTIIVFGPDGTPRTCFVCDGGTVQCV